MALGRAALIILALVLLLAIGGPLLMANVVGGALRIAFIVLLVLLVLGLLGGAMRRPRAV